ncbi:hypothetical protein R1sor_001985 [Riccia sorocarpa]|uniref:TPX2 C-terminal domain-containing protein n=1 Tax=Riccia sorocarpa TaxID=122646 RepID=A0ABD3GYB7_9MARC
MGSATPPLQQLVYQGSPGKNPFSKKDWGTPPSSSLRQSTSENCDPNLEKADIPGVPFVFGKSDIPCGAAATNSVGKDKGKDLAEEDHGPQNEGREELTEDEKGGTPNRCKEKGTPQKSGQQQFQQFKSPTKAAALSSPGNGVGHEHHRHHFCRSPRCASNNPDYATPAQIPPRKYLISKRHLIPGAICTRDPSTLPSSQIPLPPLSGGKPPARPSPSTASKLPTNNAIRQLSYKEASPDRSQSPPPHQAAGFAQPGADGNGSAEEAVSSSTDVGSAPRQVALLQNDEKLSQDVDRELETRRQQQNKVDPSSGLQVAEQRSLDGIAAQKDEDSGGGRGEGSPCAQDEDPEQLQSADATDCEVENHKLNREERGSCDEGEDVDVLQSVDVISPKPVNHGRNSGEGDYCNELRDVQQLPSRDGLDPEETVEYGLNGGDFGGEVQEVEQRTHEYRGTDCLQELISKNYCDAELDVTSQVTSSAACDQTSGSVSSVYDESSDLTTLPAESSHASASVVSHVPAEEKPVLGACFGLTDCQPLDDDLSPQAENNLHSTDELPPDVDNVTKALEQRLVLDEMEKASSPQGQSSCDDGIVDICDLAATPTSCPEEEEEEEAAMNGDYILLDTPPEEGVFAENVQSLEAEVVTDLSTSRDFLKGKAVQDCQDEGKSDVVGSISPSEESSQQPESSSKKSAEESKMQRAPPRFGRSKGRLMWRNDCRNSREIVNLKATNYDRQQGDWKLDNLLEGAVNQLQPSGEGRVRRLVQAFESLMNISEPEPEKRPSRVWCFNKKGKGKVGEGGDDCESGDQRVDCYEVSGDRLELRASLRLSLGGSSRQDICSVEDEDEMTPMQKVQDWDDHEVQDWEDRQASNSFENGGYAELCSGDQGGEKGSPSTDHAEMSEESPSSPQARMNEKERKRVQMYNEVKQQLGYKTEDNVKMRIQRYGRPKSSKSSSVKSETESNLGSAEKNARAIRNTHLEPFRLLTEQRGALKEYMFAKKLEQLFAEEERLRNPIAQGLPWTTDEPEIVPKPPVKQPTRHVDFSHHSDSRAAMRAEFDNYMAQRELAMKMRREEAERQRQIAEQEEIRRLRREMVPRAQLMPFFDQPFMPARSSKRLTVPKEPKFKPRQHKRAKCVVLQQEA